MEGASITLMRLDDDLQNWLDHPCETPALRVEQSQGAAEARPRQERASEPARSAKAVDHEALKTGGDIGPPEFLAMIHAGAEAIFAARDRLCELDGEIGDGDHGITMETGWKAVLEDLSSIGENTTITEICDRIADVFLDAVGASAGPLYATGFGTAGQAVSDRLNLDATSLAKWLDGLAQGIATRGEAKLGEKTMLDAWRPAADAALAHAKEASSAYICLSAASEAAKAGAVATAGMRSAKGRSKKLGDRALGHIDPGAESAAILMAAWSRRSLNVKLQT